MKRIAALTLAITLLYACASVPVTGRKQLNVVSNGEIFPMSFQQYEKVIKESKLSSNQAQSAMIKSVGGKIKTAVEAYMASIGASSSLQGFSWDFNLIEEDVVNAWCMPGGKVAFYTGIMPVCKDEVGVAVVMGHEVAHAIANHGAERMSQGMAVNMGLSSLSSAMGSNPTMTEQIFLQSAGLGSQLGVLAYSRTHESEADKIGLIFMAMAGYDPNAAPAFWERMKSMSGGSAQPEFMSTHPSHDKRIQDLKASVPEAMKYYKK